MKILRLLGQVGWFRHGVLWTEDRKEMTVRMIRCTQMDNMTNLFLMNCDNLMTGNFYYLNISFR